MYNIDELSQKVDTLEATMADLSSKLDQVLTFTKANYAYLHEEELDYAEKPENKYPQVRGEDWEGYLQSIWDKCRVRREEGFEKYGGHMIDQCNALEILQALEEELYDALNYLMFVTVRLVVLGDAVKLNEARDLYRRTK